MFVEVVNVKNVEDFVYIIVAAFIVVILLISF